ncbi:hypothetical protein [Gordonia bronchialis]|nr:hypothetical protein [Gordonia bronchialis]
MHRTAASSAATALQWSLHVLAVVLAGVVALRALIADSGGGVAAAALALAWAITYVVGAVAIAGKTPLHPVGKA